MDGAAETDARVPPKQAVFWISREPGSRMEADRTRAQSQLIQQPVDDPTITRANPFVGVDIEDPLARRVVDRKVSRRGEVILPLVIDDAGGVRGRNFAAAVAGPGVNDDDFIRERGDRL